LHVRGEYDYRDFEADTTQAGMPSSIVEGRRKDNAETLRAQRHAEKRREKKRALALLRRASKEASATGIFRMGPELLGVGAAL
jgi:hypothetical protein